MLKGRNYSSLKRKSLELAALKCAESLFLLYSLGGASWLYRGKCSRGLDTGYWFSLLALKNLSYTKLSFRGGCAVFEEVKRQLLRILASVELCTGVPSTVLLSDCLTLSLDLEGLRCCSF